jgi:hypothetical protein
MVACATGSTETTEEDDGDGDPSGPDTGAGAMGGGTNTGTGATTSTSSGPEGGSGNTGAGTSSASTTSSNATTNSTATTTTAATTSGGCTPVDVVNGGNFEAGPGGGDWTEASTTFGTPLCDVATCGTGGGTGPSGGAFWAWFGGFVGGNEIATVTQTVNIPSGGMAVLEFDLEMPSCDGFGFDFFEARIDGNPVFYIDDSSNLCGQIGYTQQAVDVSAYANGGNHTLQLYGDTVSLLAPTNFMVDDVQLIACQ